MTVDKSQKEKRARIESAQKMWAASVLRAGGDWGEKNGLTRAEGILAFLRKLEEGGHFFAHYDPDKNDLVWEHE